MSGEFQARKLLPGDEQILDAFLAPVTPFAYFMRSNVRAGGLLFQNKTYQADYFGAFNKGALKGLLAHSWLGSIQIFAPEKSSRGPLVAALTEHLRIAPRSVNVFLGPSDHVQDVIDLLGLSEQDFREGRHREFLYELDLNEMRIPEILKDPAFSVRRATEEDLTSLVAWEHDYHVEALKERPGQATLQMASERITRRIEEGAMFVLETERKILSYCGAHGYLPDWKNVGPVWTLPEQRNRGYSRAVTAGALSILKSEGASHATLFARSPQAIRSYRALGFRQIGDWRLALLKAPRSHLV